LTFKRKISGVAGASCFVSGDDERGGAARRWRWPWRWRTGGEEGRGGLDGEQSGGQGGAGAPTAAAARAGRREAGQIGPKKNAAHNGYARAQSGKSGAMAAHERIYKGKDPIGPLTIFQARFA